MTNSRHAILIGINHYDSTGFSELEFCVKDAEALGEVLRKEENYQTQLLTSTSESNSPTAQNIETALKNVSQASNTLLVYFSGHGHRDEAEEPMLVTCDGSTLPLADVIALMNQSPASQKILLLDACFQGLDTKALAGDLAKLFQQSASKREENANSQRAKPKRTSAFYSGYALFHDSEGFAMLAASTASQMAREAVALDHGYFTYHLLEGLRGKALRDNKPFVTVVDLALYAARQLRNMSWGEGFQEPTALLAMKGDLILLKTASFTPDSRPQIVPRRMAFRYNVRFVSRKKQLETLKETFRNNNQREIIVVTGIGGVGKTQIAGQFVYEHERDFPGGVFWLNFANGEQVLSEIADCGSKLYLNLKGFDPEKPKENAILVKAEWNKEGGPRRLLIFDNCENPALLRDHLPNSDSNCAVLVTSRRSEKDWPKHNLGSDEKPFFLSDSQILALDVLKDDSLSFFEKFRKFNAEEKGILSDIAETLGHLPLALHLAGSTLGSPGMKGKRSVETYLADLERNPFVADSEYLKQVADLAKAGEDRGVDGETDTPTYHPNVSRSFEITYAQLKPGSSKEEEKYDDLALKLLFRAAFFKPAEPIPADLLKKTAFKYMTNIEGFNPVDVIPVDVIPADMLKKTVSRYRTEEQKDKWDAKLLGALERLVNLGFLEWAGREDVEGYAMHTLTSAFVRARAIAVERKAEKEDDPSEKAKGEQQAGNLQKELDSAQEDVERVFYDLSEELTIAGEIVEIFRSLPHLRLITEVAMKRESEYAVGLSANLAMALAFYFDDPEAEKYLLYVEAICDRYIEAYKSGQVTENDVIVDAINTLTGMMQDTLGFNKHAKGHEYLHFLVETNPEDAEYLGWLVFSFLDRGEYREAYEKARLCLEKCDPDWEKGDFEANLPARIPPSYNCLHAVLLRSGEYLKALHLAKRQEAIFRQNEKGTFAKVTVICNLAHTTMFLGDYVSTERGLSEAKRIIEEEMPKEETKSTFNYYVYSLLGLLHLKKQEYEVAQKELEFAQTKYETSQTNSLVSLSYQAQNLENLALLWKEMEREGHLENAHNYASRSLAICQRFFCKDHPELARSYQTLGEVLLAQGDLGAARENLTKALTIRQAKLGDANSLTAESRYTLALLTAAEGNSQEAAVLMRQALAIRETKLGPAHPLTQASRQQLATIEQKASQI